MPIYDALAVNTIFATNWLISRVQNISMGTHTHKHTYKNTSSFFLSIDFFYFVNQYELNHSHHQQQQQEHTDIM